MPNIAPQNPQAPHPKSSFLDYLDEGRLTDWLSYHGKNILYGLAGLIALLVLIYAFSSHQKNKAEQDYIQASHDFTFFSKANETQDPALVDAALERLTKLMGNHPELHAVYDGSLAQIFLNRLKADEARPYAIATLARVRSNDLPFYNDYAETTLLISEEKFKSALENAQALQQKMKETIERQAPRSFGDALFILNLLRIGLLQEELGDGKEELLTWKEWNQYANSGASQVYQINREAFRDVIEQLAIGSFSLQDYILHRENLLRKE